MDSIFREDKTRLALGRESWYNQCVSSHCELAEGGTHGVADLEQLSNDVYVERNEGYYSDGHEIEVGEEISEDHNVTIMERNYSAT